MLWCGRLPILEYGGGILISREVLKKFASSHCFQNVTAETLLNRKKNDKEMPQEVQVEFRRRLKEFGLDWDDLCPSNNDHCPVESEYLPPKLRALPDSSDS